MFIRIAIIIVSIYYLRNITGRILVQLLVVSKYDDGHIYGAENRQLMRLLEQTALALEKCYRSVPVVLDGLDLNLASAHSSGCVVLDAPSLLEQRRRVENAFESTPVATRIGFCAKRDGGLWNKTRALLSLHETAMMEIAA